MQLNIENIFLNLIGQFTDKCNLFSVCNTDYEYEDNEVIELRPREFELLYYLCENAGNIVSRDKLFSKVWGYSFAGNSKTLDVHIQRIRERIEVNPKSPKRLVTIRGVGYKLND